MPQSIKQRFQHVDKVFWVMFFILIGLSIVVLFSASSTLSYHSANSLAPITSHVAFLFFGIIVAMVIQFLPSSLMRPVAYLLLLVSFIFLCATLFPSLPFVHTINGATRWVSIFGIMFQPAELAKLSLIIVVADLLVRIKDKESEKKIFFIIMGITSVVCLLILKENMSTGLLISGIVFLMLFLGRVNWKYLVGTLAVVAVLVVGTYLIVEHHYVRQNRTISGPLHRLPTQIKRIDKWLFADKNDITKGENDKLIPLSEMDGNEYQTTLSHVAVARGGSHFPFGVGPGRSRERDFLPLAFSDYIFAIVVEEWGLFGATILIVLYAWILFRACLKSSSYSDNVAMLMVMGLALMITCQALVSMAVSVGILPVTGQPLPLISRGGTSIVITSVYFGILMCVAREQNEQKALHEQNIKESYEAVPTINIEE